MPRVSTPPSPTSASTCSPTSTRPSPACATVASTPATRKGPCPGTPWNPSTGKPDACRWPTSTPTATTRISIHRPRMRAAAARHSRRPRARPAKPPRHPRQRPRVAARRRRAAALRLVGADISCHGHAAPREPRTGRAAASSSQDSRLEIHRISARRPGGGARRARVIIGASRACPPGEIARLVDALPYLHAAELLTLLPDKLAADTLEAMSAHRQLQVLRGACPRIRASRCSSSWPPTSPPTSSAACTPRTARAVLDRLPPEASARIVELLRYPEDTVGSIMTNDVLSDARHAHRGRGARSAARDGCASRISFFSSTWWTTRLRGGCAAW